jgi:hypothetical protein
MGPLALLAAAVAAAAVAVPGAGKLVAVGLGLAAVVAGVLAYRRGESRAGRRLAGAAGAAVGSIALLLGSAKVALTLVAIERLGRIFQ